MAWPENEARERILEHLLIFREHHGQAGLIDLLEQELCRERVVKRYKEQQQAAAAAEARQAELAAMLDTTAEALEFYGNADNYEARGGRLSAIQKDKGGTARNALAAIDPEADGEE
jgi:hypothetical protein